MVTQEGQRLGREATMEAYVRRNACYSYAFGCPALGDRGIQSAGQRCMYQRDVTGWTAGVSLATLRPPRPGRTRTRSPWTLSQGLVNTSPKTTTLPPSFRTPGKAKSRQPSRESCLAGKRNLI